MFAEIQGIPLQRLTKLPSRPGGRLVSRILVSEDAVEQLRRE